MIERTRVDCICRPQAFSSMYWVPEKLHQLYKGLCMYLHDLCVSLLGKKSNSRKEYNKRIKKIGVPRSDAVTFQKVLLPPLLCSRHTIASYTHMHTKMHMHTQMHTHTHTHTHAHARARACTHTYI
jgi:hypothetical protein